MAGQMKFEQNTNVEFLPGQGGFRPKAVYVDGKRTDEQARDGEGRPLWVHRGARCELFGEVYDDVNVEVAAAVEPKLEVKGLLAVAQLMGPVGVSVRARARGGDFADLVVTLTGRAVAAKGDAK